MLKKAHPLLVVLVGYIFLELFKSIQLVSLLIHTDFSSTFFGYLSLIMVIALCAYLVYYFIKCHSVGEFLIVSKEEKRISLIVLGLVFVSTVIVINLAYFSSTISNFHIYTLNVRKVPLSLHFLIFSLICSPIFEEILFRGVLQKYLSTIIKNPIIPIVLTSIVFSMGHLQFAKVPFYFLCGFLNGCIYYKTQKIIIPIIAHAFWNLLNVIFIMDLQPMSRGNSLVFLIFIIIFVILANLLYKYERVENDLHVINSTDNNDSVK